MCEKCDEIQKKLADGAVATVEERVALTAIAGSLLDQHGPEAVVDLFANVLGFVDYRTGTTLGDEKRADMRALLVSLLEDYYVTSDTLVAESQERVETAEEVSGTIH